MPAAAGVVDEKGSEYILAHTGPRELDGHPLGPGGCGSRIGLVPGYTTHSVRVRANIKFGAVKIKSVRTNEERTHWCLSFFKKNSVRSYRTNKQTNKQTNKYVRFVFQTRHLHCESTVAST